MVAETKPRAAAVSFATIRPHRRDAGRQTTPNSISRMTSFVWRSSALRAPFGTQCCALNGHVRRPPPAPAGGAGTLTWP